MKRPCVVILFLLVLALLGAPSADAAPPQPSIRVLDWNMAGGARGHGEIVKRPAAVVDLVRRTQPTIVTLQEICYTQYGVIRDQLGRLGYYATHTKVRTNGSCHDKVGGNSWGNALFIRTDQPVRDRERYALPWGKNPKGSFARQPRAMVCATTRLEDREVRACSVHVTVRDPDKRQQIDRVASILGPIAATDETLVVLSGDFNSQVYPPRDLDFLQSGSRRDTTDSKKHLDWVLATAPVTVVDVIHTSLSDHHIVVADVSLSTLVS